MGNKYEKMIYALVILTLPISFTAGIPLLKSILPIGGTQISIYIVIFGILLSIYQKKNVERLDLLIKYILLFLASYSISVFWGIFQFDYPTLFTSNIGHNAKHILELVENSISISITEKTFSIILLAYKGIFKSAILLPIFIVGTVYWIMSNFKSKWTDAVDIFMKCLCIIYFISIGYSCIEVFYLKGYAWATNALLMINPHLYHISFDNSVAWPPVLWGDRMRSIFAEPSYMAIFFASTLPLFFTTLFTNKYKKYSTLIYLLIFGVFFMMFGADSKTAMVLIICLMIYALGIGIAYRKSILKQVLIIEGCILIAAASYFLLVKTPIIIPSENPAVQWNIVKDIQKKMNIQYNSIPSKQYKAEQIEQSKVALKQEVVLDQYVEKNVENVANVNYGSNSSRYGLTFAEFGVFLSKPVFGAGSAELLQPYIYECLPAFSDNEEVRRWRTFNWEHGVMSNQLPVLNFFTNQLAKNGIICFIIFWLPLVYFTFIIVKHMKYFNYQEKQYIIAMFMSVFCLLVSCMSATLNLFFTYWIILGILGTVAFSIKDKNNNAEKISE